MAILRLPGPDTPLLRRLRQHTHTYTLLQSGCGLCASPVRSFGGALLLISRSRRCAALARNKAAAGSPADSVLDLLAAVAVIAALRCGFPALRCFHHFAHRRRRLSGAAATRTLPARPILPSPARTGTDGRDVPVRSRLGQAMQGVPIGPPCIAGQLAQPARLCKGCCRPDPAGKGPRAGKGPARPGVLPCPPGRPASESAPLAAGAAGC